MFEPWTVRTRPGGPYKAFTPFWRACLENGEPRYLPSDAELEAWQRGQTGYPPVDAGVRQLLKPPEQLGGYPEPVVGLPESRERALETYQKPKDS
jgi:deoxyribodipyrimidine photolyase